MHACRGTCRAAYNAASRRPGRACKWVSSASHASFACKLPPCLCHVSSTIALHRHRNECAQGTHLAGRAHVYAEEASIVWIASMLSIAYSMTIRYRSHARTNRRCALASAKSGVSELSLRAEKCRWRLGCKILVPQISRPCSIEKPGDLHQEVCASHHISLRLCQGALDLKVADHSLRAKSGYRSVEHHIKGI